MSRENQHNITNVVFLGENGFPKGLAAIQRMTLMAKALLVEGCKTTVICRKGVGEQDHVVSLCTKGKYEGIDYLYTSKNVFKPKGFLDRNIQKLKGLFDEYGYLKYLKKQGEIDVAIVSNMSAIHMLRYCFYARWLNFPVVLNFVEMASSMQHRSSFSKRINDSLFDRWIIKFFDAALPISNQLLDHYNRVVPTKPSLKLPILCDFEKFNIQSNRQESYFLYCGSIAYKDVIDFVLQAYNSINQKEKTKLYMIISGGSKDESQFLQKQMNEGFENQSVRLFSNIPYEELVELYINAIALLIPLRPTLQDASRFPHKIGEYLASGNPMITTNVGEIKNYFEDGETALIANTYKTDAFAEKMQYILQHPEEAKVIGSNGKKLGLNEFDYRTQGGRLKTFLEEVLMIS
ncbi:Glycosyltransferase involved in cell wall bisynthesis [Pricia antarctica]|uniref:Glycosyltransferase involved in cell wall bisynthesis n=1 Tax=Pricia antarctica TaxID=641691 RepID=A0A1G6YPP8_9FLAO|nr:glycosyltransferase [Pricia antarctica]SDD92484.1 Glycosyltransferase involved in cell wall bisynthesis [Pricia antarctica]